MCPLCCLLENEPEKERLIFISRFALNGVQRQRQENQTTTRVVLRPLQRFPGKVGEIL